MDIIPEKDSFIYKHNNDIYHFVYTKISKEQFNNLFITHKVSESISNPYICIFFDPNNKCYIGHLTEDEIQQLILQSDMINLLDNDFEYLNKLFPILTKEKYQEKLSLTKEQFEYFTPLKI